MLHFDAVAASMSALRARLESELPSPGLLCVTSALAGDGKSVTAYEVALAFTRAGHRTLLVDANEFCAGSKPACALADIARIGVYPLVSANGSGETPATISIATGTSSVQPSKEVVSAACAQFRAQFSYTVVDTAPAPQSALAISFATASDGVLLAVREGRSQHLNDKLVVDLLKHAGVYVSGVVMTGRAARARFLNRAEQPGAAKGLPALSKLFEVV
jgi:Mrp family chromosome partitioning ATPase